MLKCEKLIAGFTDKLYILKPGAKLYIIFDTVMDLFFTYAVITHCSL
jgi:hypothetical protein